MMSPLGKRGTRGGERERERDAHQVKTGGGGANAEPKVTEAELEKTSQMCRTYRPSL